MGAFANPGLREANLYLVTPPGRVERTGSTHPLFGRMSLTRGVSLLKEHGTYRQVETPSAEEMTAAEAVYLGGHRYPVSAAEAGALIAAGYGEWLASDITTYAYGQGPYGVGIYGG